MKALVGWLAGMLVSCSALATNDTVAALNWRLDFGAQAFEAGYGLSLGYRSAEHFAPLSRLVELKVDHGSALAAIAGLPLAARGYQSNQTGDAAYDAGLQEKTPEQPWYARQWVWWTLGGLAATAAILGNNNSTSEQHTAQIQDNGSASPVSINGDMEGGYTACADGTSVCTSIPGQGGG